MTSALDYYLRIYVVLNEGKNTSLGLWVFTRATMHLWQRGPRETIKNRILNSLLNNVWRTNAAVRRNPAGTRGGVSETEKYRTSRMSVACMHEKKTAAYLPVRERVQRGNNPINTLECGRKDGDGTFGRYLGPGDCLHALAEQNSKYTYAGSHQLLHPPRSSGSIRRRS